MRLRWFLEAIALLLVLFTFGVVAVHYNGLPDSVPRHYGFSGRPDAYGPKSMMWLLPCVSALLYALTSFCQRYPKLINLPFQVDRDDPEVRSILDLMTLSLKTVVAAMFSWLTRAGMETAFGTANGLGTYFLPVSLGAIGMILIVFLRKLRR